MMNWDCSTKPMPAATLSNPAIGAACAALVITVPPPRAAAKIIANPSFLMTILFL
jgi:hypothetical protein